ncbi:MAG TPA: PAS domain S-box protein [Polyangiaceae bacterium]|nr:PAS domain S-box protein [Polyangiaceae bacterium]
MAIGAPVLVVDDDAASRRTLCDALAAADLEATSVSNGTDALQWLTRQLPSAVLLDLIMPDPDGYAILRAIRARPALRDTPVIVMTSFEGDDEPTRAFAAGADDFIKKPCRPSEVIARVRGQLRVREYVDALARRERDAQVVLELTQALSSSLDFRDILFTVVRRIAEVAKVERCSIVLVRDEGDVGYVVAASDDVHLRDLPIDLNQYPEIREVMASGEPLVIRDTQTHPLLEVVRKGLPAAVFSSLALLPILFEGKPMGVLFLRARHVLAFGAHELSLYRTIANATAIALRNARVLQSLRDQTQQITFARFEAERRLKTLQRYADFFESAADGIVVIDSEGKLLFSNPRAREITGHGESDLIGRTLGDLFAEDERERAHSIRLGFQKGIYPQGVDIRIRRKDGAVVLLSVNTSSVLREENAILFTFRDVTQERATEAELKQTKEFLERVIDSSVDAIVAADMRGRVLLFNRAAERCYGYPPEEVVGKINVSQLYPPGVAREVMRLIKSEMFGGTGRLEDYRCDMLGKGGERVPVSLSAALIYDDGKPVASVGLFTDLRERLQMQERLAAAQQELRAREKQAIIAELAGAAAHELNQPLTSVMGYAELLKRRLDRDSPAFSAAHVIVNEAERMAEIVRKIGKITKYETKSYVGAAKILDLDKASEETEPAAAAGSEPTRGRS